MTEKRPYGELNKQFIVIDLHDDPEEPDVLAGVAIAKEDAQDFLAEVERLAVEKYGGATFEELLDYDNADASASASAKQANKELFESVIAAAEQILKNAQEKGLR